MKSGIYALSARPRVLLAAVCTLLSLLVLLSAKQGAPRPLEQQNSHYTPHLKAAQISQRALALCASFSNFSRLLQEPIFQDEMFLSDPVVLQHRPVWTAICEADGKRYYVQYSDVTGNLVGLMPNDGLLIHLPSGKANALKTQAEAASAGMRRLSEMHLVPQGTRVALRADPELVDGGHAWEMFWKARPASDTRTYEIKLVLARNGAIPIIALDRRELKRYPVR